jgi:hypothetical protein
VDGRVVCFEIDGERHFVGINGGRRREDVVKDAFMTANHHGLLRLHYKDKDNWLAFIQHFLALNATSTMYSGYFWHELDVNDRYVTVIRI